MVTGDVDDGGETSWNEPHLTAETLAFLQYTSGSTGEPRGVKLSHQNLIHNSRLIQESFGVTADSRIVSWLPPYHDMGLIGCVLQPLYTGAVAILMSPLLFLQRPLRWLNAIARYRATHSGGPNFGYELCIARIAPEQRSQLDLRSWQIAFNGAEPIRADTLQRFATGFAPSGFRPEAFSPCYGLAESTLLVSGGRSSGPPTVKTVQSAALEKGQIVEAHETEGGARKLTGCGQVPPGQKVVIVNPETLQACPGRIGEIWVAGPSVSQGYWNLPDRSSETFNAHLSDTGEGPFLRTGDLGFVEGGELFVTGRIKDLVIICGRNLYPQDIELTVAQSHPSLSSGATAAFSIAVEGEEKLVVVQEEGRRRVSSSEEVTRAIRGAVAEEHGVQVFAVELIKPGRIPKTSSGKVQRHACREWYLAKALTN
jgi:acyl-CoA synthetase (AMP-forming)/AMP-acid ligase II